MKLRKRVLYNKRRKIHPLGEWSEARSTNHSHSLKDSLFEANLEPNDNIQTEDRINSKTKYNRNTKIVPKNDPVTIAYSKEECVI